MTADLGLVRLYHCHGQGAAIKKSRNSFEFRPTQCPGCVDGNTACCCPHAGELMCRCRTGTGSHALRLALASASHAALPLLMALLALLRASAAILLLLLARTLVLVTHLSAARALALFRTLLAAALAALRLLLLPLALLPLLALLGLPRLLLLLSHCCLHVARRTAASRHVARHMPALSLPPQAGFPSAAVNDSSRFYKSFSRFTWPRAARLACPVRTAHTRRTGNRYGDCRTAAGPPRVVPCKQHRRHGRPFRFPA